jgi:hypothetical protein
MTTRTLLALLLLAVLVLPGLADDLPAPTAADDAMCDRDSAIRAEAEAALRAAGIKADVIYRGGKRVVRCYDQAAELRRVEAQALVDEAAARGALVLEPATLEDALAVLRFEPRNEKAQQIVRARYDALRAEVRAKRGGPR